ncbi:hypothetical protein ACJJTC_018571 [Scirpophaga incertulas]
MLSSAATLTWAGRRLRAGRARPPRSDVEQRGHTHVGRQAAACGSRSPPAERLRAGRARPPRSDVEQRGHTHVGRQAAACGSRSPPAKLMLSSAATLTWAGRRLRAGRARPPRSDVEQRGHTHVGRQAAACGSRSPPAE